MDLWNGRIAGNPINWVIVGVMVLLFAFGLHIVLASTSAKGTTNE